MEFKLEKWNTNLISDVEKVANNKKIADNLRDVFPFPYTFSDANYYINDCIEKEGENQLVRAIIVDGKAVGSIGIFVGTDVYSLSAELGYWLGEPYWNCGIMSSAVKEISKEAFEKFNIVRIYAEPFAYNTGSRRVLEKAGFILEGIMKKGVCKNGVIYDYCMYGLVKE